MAWLNVVKFDGGCCVGSITMPVVLDAWIVVIAFYHQDAKAPGASWGALDHGRQTVSRKTYQGVVICMQSQQR